MNHFHIIKYNENGILISFPQQSMQKANRQVVLLEAFCRSNCHQWLINQVPAYESMLLIADNNENISRVKEAVNLFLMEDSPEPPLNRTNEVVIPVCYDPKLGNDLEEMSAFHKIGMEALVSMHQQVDYHVYMLGFLPGFAYMGEVDIRIATPRKPVPVPTKAGAVGIAGIQTGIYPLNSPGGWNIVGYTPYKMFDVMKKAPSLLQPGDRVKFVPIDLNTYNNMVRNNGGN